MQFIVLLENAVGNAVLSVPYGMLEKLKFELYSFLIRSYCYAAANCV